MGNAPDLLELNPLYNLEDQLSRTIREATSRMGSALDDKDAHLAQVAQMELFSVREKIRKLEGKPPYGAPPRLP